MQGLKWLIEKSPESGCLRRKARRSTVPETAAIAVANTIPFEANIDDMMITFFFFDKLCKFGWLENMGIEKNPRFFVGMIKKLVLMCVCLYNWVMDILYSLNKRGKYYIDELVVEDGGVNFE